MMKIKLLDFREHSAEKVGTFQNLFVVKLKRDGSVQFYKLDKLEQQIIENGTITVEGVPLTVTIKDGEFLVVATMAKLCHKAAQSKFEIRVYQSSAPSIRIFDIEHGNFDGSGNQDFWQAPLLEMMMNLHRHSFFDEEDD